MLVAHTGHSSQLLPVTTARNAQFLTTVPRGGLIHGMLDFIVLSILSVAAEVCSNEPQGMSSDIPAWLRVRVHGHVGTFLPSMTHGVPVTAVKSVAVTVPGV